MGMNTKHYFVYTRNVKPYTVLFDKNFLEELNSLKVSSNIMIRRKSPALNKK